MKVSYNPMFGHITLPSPIIKKQDGRSITLEFEQIGDQWFASENRTPNRTPVTKPYYKEMIDWTLKLVEQHKNRTKQDKTGFSQAFNQVIGKWLNQVDGKWHETEIRKTSRTEEDAFPKLLGDFCEQKGISQVNCILKTGEGSKRIEAEFNFAGSKKEYYFNQSRNEWINSITAQPVRPEDKERIEKVLQEAGKNKIP